jgi:hypothetical protein
MQANISEGGMKNKQFLKSFFQMAGKERKNVLCSPM